MTQVFEHYQNSQSKASSFGWPEHRDTIIYKGARMKIKNATNNKITYVLLRNFNLH